MRVEGCGMAVCCGPRMNVWCPRMNVGKRLATTSRLEPQVPKQKGNATRSSAVRPWHPVKLVESTQGLWPQSFAHHRDGTVNGCKPAPSEVPKSALHAGAQGCAQALTPGLQDLCAELFRAEGFIHIGLWQLRPVIWLHNQLQDRG